jgi:hypothetical protein
MGDFFSGALAEHADDVAEQYASVPSPSLTTLLPPTNRETGPLSPRRQSTSTTHTPTSAPAVGFSPILTRSAMARLAGKDGVPFPSLASPTTKRV